MALVIGGSTFADPVIGLHGLAGQYWLSAHYHAAQYAIEKVHAPGEAGNKVKRHGFSGRPMEFEVVIIGANAAACHTARGGVETNVANQAVSITIPNGSTYPSCEVTEVSVLRGPRKTEAGTYRMHVRIVADQMRTE